MVSPTLLPIANVAAGPGSGMRAVDSDRPIPTSSGQRRLWFLEQMEPGSPLYNIPYLIRLSGELNERALDQALAAIVKRHESLRTNFVAVGSEPAQVIKKSWTLELPVTDLSAITESGREA